MSSTHLSAAPNDPYQWRESVLSTRSLSYLSTTDAMSSAGHARDRSISTTSQRAHPSRQNTDMTDDSDYSLEMASASRVAAELNDIPELPDAVAESPLFLLPREIRDRVYALCLTEHHSDHIEWPGASRSYGLQPQLLRTCKLIHDEAAPLLYTGNTIAYHHPSDANMFVRAMTETEMARQIQSISLHMRAQDNRLWIPYLMSRDKHRSLEADFPRLKVLTVRFRSNKWQHQLSAEANMKIWSEDTRFDEVVDGLRNVYFPNLLVYSRPSKRRGGTAGHGSTANTMAPIERTDTGSSSKDQSMDVDEPPMPRTPRYPLIRIICACRVHTGHFNALTTPPSPQIQTAGLSTPAPAVPVKEGSAFVGFTPVDLRVKPVARLDDPDLGTAMVANTVFTKKDGVDIALEIHCLETRKEGGGPVTGGVV